MTQLTTKTAQELKRLLEEEVSFKKWEYFIKDR